ncbi:hypothetical protein KI387_016089, partial [Taxus chinensis]
GACGYESFASTLNHGGVATASPQIYKEGVGCGACYQIRCTNQAICRKSGVKVVVTDHTENNQTDFVVSVRTFSSFSSTLKICRACEDGHCECRVQTVETSNWKYMTRNHGAVWSMEKPPRRDLSVRWLVTSGYDGYW